jgi:hypothetical protein
MDPQLLRLSRPQAMRGPANKRFFKMGQDHRDPVIQVLWPMPPRAGQLTIDCLFFGLLGDSR